MHHISGNYPEVWVQYRIKGDPDKRSHLVEDVHTVGLAIELFTKHPPHLENGMEAKIVGIHYWMSPMKWQDIALKDVKELNGGFEWRTTATGLVIKSFARRTKR